MQGQEGKNSPMMRETVYDTSMKTP